MGRGLKAGSAGRRRKVRAFVVALVLGYFMFLLGKAEIDLYMLNRRTAAAERSLSALQGRNRSLAVKLRSLAGAGAARKGWANQSGEILYRMENRPSG